MIFDKNFSTSAPDTKYLIYQEEKADNLSDPYADSPYFLRSIQKIKERSICKKKSKVIDDCINSYTKNIEDNTSVFRLGIPEESTQKSFSEYAKAAYEKVMRDLKHIEILTEGLDFNKGINL